LWTSVSAQADLQQMVDTEKAFEQVAGDEGPKSAFLKFLANDSIVFRPNAINGKDFWTSWKDPKPTLLSRNITYADISSNGLLGYTTGNWRLYPKGKGEELAQFGQYVTIWEKKPDGKFHATLDIGIIHEKLPFFETDRVFPTDNTKDLNIRGWSPADASMNFLRMSMSNEALSGAYKKFAGEDVRLLREREPPIIGKKNVVAETKHYISTAFPRKVALLQSADMAYTWNPCKFDNSNEGTEEGNCLHIWKLRNKKWWIVLGVFSPVVNETPPTLQIKQKSKGKKTS
jgi:ketosteroid isomerase-like protein